MSNEEKKTHKGPRPFTEEEIQAMKQNLKEIKEREATDPEYKKMREERKAKYKIFNVKRYD